MILGGPFDISRKRDRINELLKEMEKDNFWQDIEKANGINQELNGLKKEITSYENLKKEIKSNNEMIELLEIEYSLEIKNELENSIIRIEKDLESLELNTLFTGDYDNKNCYLEIHPGAGGTEACDWASMLLRMYQRFCDKNEFKYELIEEQKGDEAGISRATLHIIGPYAYGNLKCERGVHRLVRISPFDSNKRRHTSFASVTVTPEIDKTINVEIKDEDIRIDTFCASGHGGQGVNTTPSAIRITHFPSKIVVTCQNERSQLQNKEQAMNVLRSKLFLLEQEKKQQEINQLKGISTGIDFGSQIRSYVLEPYKLVKDNRSNYEMTEVNKVLDGDIKPFIESILKMK